MYDLQRLRLLLTENGLGPGKTLGIIGVGTFGTALRDAAEALGADTLLCDPPRSREESDELNDALHVEWGNGMGGCDFSALRTETFLPMDFLAKFSDAIAVCVPLTDAAPDATRGLISASYLALCRPHCRILCFSDERVIASDVKKDPSKVLFFAVFCLQDGKSVVH